MRVFVLLILAGSLAGAVSAASQRRIAFAGTQGGRWAVYSAGANGGGVRKLTAGSGAFESEPSWAPDGKRLVYVCRNFELCVMNADGSGKHRITTTNWPQAWIYDLDPAWSPDGSWIAYSANDDGDYNLYLVHPNGSGKKRLTNASRDESEPAWSADGKHIVFASDANGLGDIYVVDADGSHTRRVTTTRDDEEAPSWSPDGTKIAYDRELDKEQNDLFVVTADGSKVTRLTNTANDEGDVAWAPDGSAILYDRDRHLYSVRPDGSRPQKLGLPKDSVLGAWQPQGGPGGPAARGPAPGKAEANARWVAGLLTYAAQSAQAGPGSDTPAGLKKTARVFRSEAARVRRALTNPPSARARETRRSMLAFAAGLERAAPIMSAFADAIIHQQQDRAQQLARRLLPMLQGALNDAARGFSRTGFFKTGSYWLLSAQLQ